MFITEIIYFFRVNLLELDNTVPNFISNKTTATCIMESFNVFYLSRWPLTHAELLWKCLGICISVIYGLYVFLLGLNEKFNYMKKMQIAANCVNCERVALSSNINCQ